MLNRRASRGAALWCGFIFFPVDKDSSDKDSSDKDSSDKDSSDKDSSDKDSSDKDSSDSSASFHDDRRLSERRGDKYPLTALRFR